MTHRSYNMAKKAKEECEAMAVRLRYLEEMAKAGKEAAEVAADDKRARQTMTRDDQLLPSPVSIPQKGTFMLFLLDFFPDGTTTIIYEGASTARKGRRP